MYGPADLADLVTGRHLSNDPARQFLGQDLPDWLARAGAASPLEHVSRDDFSHPSRSRVGRSVGAARAVAANGRESGPGRRTRPPDRRSRRDTASSCWVKFPETRDLLPEILAFLDSVWQVHLHEHR